MIRSHSQKQLSLAEFDWPFQTKMDENNRWVVMARCIPWDQLADGYHQSLSANKGRPAKDARLVIGAVIIKHKLCLSDEETVAQIQENPYLQYFVGLAGYQTKQPFVPSLFVEIRKRMGAGVFEAFHQAIINSVEHEQQKSTPASKTLPSDDNEPPTSTATSENDQPAVVEKSMENRGKLILDATVAPQAIRYPTDLNLLNEAREISEQVIDKLYPETSLKSKPRTYRQQARKAYLALVKQRRPRVKERRRGIKRQLQYLRRNLQHIQSLLSHWPMGERLPLSNGLLYRYWVIQHLYTQQQAMHQNKSQRCDDRIVSISQPYVRPIIRGKQHKPVEFGAKISVSLTGDGIASVDHLRWNAFNEGQDLSSQVETYYHRYGVYPEAVLADPVYGTRANRDYLKSLGIRYSGKPLGRPKKATETNKAVLKQQKAQRREDYRQRIPVEGKFGQGKSGYDLDYIKTKRADTSAAYINSIFLVMNLLVLLKIFFAQHKVLFETLLKRLFHSPPLLNLESKPVPLFGAIDVMDSKSMMSF